MILARTPYRVSYFGGGSDYKPWYEQHGGRVLTSSLAHYCYISARWLPPFHSHKHRVVWSKVETCNQVRHIEHPAVRACLELLKIEDGVEIQHMGDLPARSGLGSSSAFTVGLLHALLALQGIMKPKEVIADMAIHVEQVMLGEAVGIQDQIECARGGLNVIEIRRDGTYDVCPVVLPLARLLEFERSLLLFFTGVQRHASAIAAQQLANLPQRSNELSAMAGMVGDALHCLTSGSLLDLGELLHRSWLLKRGLSGAVSTPEIDRLYARAREAGALGGKLLGAGGGGFMLFFAPQAVQARVRAACQGLVEVPVRFEPSGTQIMLADRGPQGAHGAADALPFARCA